MMRIVVSCLILLFGWSVARAQPKADLNCYHYHDAEGRPFTEVTIMVLVGSLHEPADSAMTKSVEATLVIENEQGALVDGQRWRLNAPSDDEKDFYHTHRSSLPPGTYQVRLELKDGVGPSERKTSTLRDSFHLMPSSEGVFLSSLAMLSNVEKAEEGSSRAKHGLIMEPLKFDFLRMDHKELRAFFEVYGTEQLKDPAYSLVHHIIYRSLAYPDTVLTYTTRRRTAVVDPVLYSVPIQKTWSNGRYTYLVEVKDASGAVLDAEEVSFILSNPQYEQKELTEEELIAKTFVGPLKDDELNYGLKALVARVDPRDVTLLGNLVENGSTINKKRFLYGYWKEFAPYQPAQGYVDYMAEVRYIDQLFFDGMGHGFESDRGYVMLKYGRPDQRVMVEDEPTAPPYEIWTYDEFPATNQNNVRFVFYSPFGNSYEMLHSTARGEINDPQWLIKLYSDSPEDVIGNSIDARNVRDHVNRRAAELFNDN